MLTPPINGFHHRGYLPHIKLEGAEYFVTFRLADSLPRSALAELDVELGSLQFPRQLPATGQEAERRLQRQRRIEELLDQGSGSAYLKSPVIAEEVRSALHHFQGDRYDLNSWVIMPNHVHVVLKPLGSHALSLILRSWKQFTSRRAKEILGLPNGRFWQPESYDHWIRGEGERSRIVQYIHNNPVKAGLCARPEEWPWSSARNGADFQSGLRSDAD